MARSWPKIAIASESFAIECVHSFVMFHMQYWSVLHSQSSRVAMAIQYTCGSGGRVALRRVAPQTSHITMLPPTTLPHPRVMIQRRRKALMNDAIVEKVKTALCDRDGGDVNVVFHCVSGQTRSAVACIRTRRVAIGGCVVCGDGGPAHTHLQL